MGNELNLRELYEFIKPEVKRLHEAEGLIAKQPFSYLAEQSKAGKEGLVILGAGGDPKEWIDGITGMLKEEGIATPEFAFTEVFVLSDNNVADGRTDLVLMFDQGIDVGQLAMWRIKFGSCSWVSDFVVNYAKDYKSAIPTADDIPTEDGGDQEEEFNESKSNKAYESMQPEVGKDTDEEIVSKLLEATSEEEARQIGDDLQVDWNTIDIKELTAGIDVELEHKEVTNGCKITSAQIALDHLKELPDYYTKLKAMEGTAVKEAVGDEQSGEIMDGFEAWRGENQKDDSIASLMAYLDERYPDVPEPEIRDIVLGYKAYLAKHVKEARVEESKVIASDVTSKEIAADIAAKNKGKALFDEKSKTWTVTVEESVIKEDQDPKQVAKYRREAEEYYNKMKISPTGDEIVNFVAGLIEDESGADMDDSSYRALAKQMGITLDESKKRPAKVNEDYGKALELRDLVRELEQTIGKLKLNKDLPSEDSIMDYPTKYNAALTRYIRHLEKIQAMFAEYATLKESKVKEGRNFNPTKVSDLAREIQELAQDIKQRPTEVGESEIKDIELACNMLRKALKESKVKENMFKDYVFKDYGFVLDFDELDEELKEKKVQAMAEFNVKNGNAEQDEAFDKNGDVLEAYRRHCISQMEARFPIYF